ncbi:MAG: hypothetical protein KatS3mg081_2571 [Gemmatimonadales bacterium]|nr:MAG: hypothetical protein KatS3mg081_2571 [Gemmatimonadales bacterium]
MRYWLALLALLPGLSISAVQDDPGVATSSILGFDSATGEIGVAV